MKEPLDELYLKWLYGQVGSVKEKNPSRTYWRLLKHLYTKEFVWFIPNDDNRAEDGKDLRYVFVEEQKINPVDEGWYRLGCSLLEMLIGVSRRLAFETDNEALGWFWKLIENLGLEQFNDNVPYPEDKIEEILNTVIFRTYTRNGHGGLFPLRRATKDQREREIWYQLCDYIFEQGY